MSEGMRWDPRLITPDRAIELVGDWPLYVDTGMAELSQFEPEGGGPRQRDRQQANLRCQGCNQSVALLATDRRPMLTSPSTLLAAVLRHAVMAHDVALSGIGG